MAVMCVLHHHTRQWLSSLFPFRRPHPVVEADRQHRSCSHAEDDWPGKWQGEKNHGFSGSTPEHNIDNWRTLCKSVGRMIFDCLSRWQLHWLVPLAVAGAVQQAEGLPGGRAGLQEAGFGPGIHGTTPGATQPAHFIHTCPVGLTDVYLDITQSFFFFFFFRYEAALTLPFHHDTQTFRTPIEHH